MRIVVNLRTTPHSNRAGTHWRSLMNIKKKEKRAMCLAWGLSCFAIPEFPVKVTFIRVAPRTLDDDNLPSCFKYMRDALAEHCFHLKNDAGPEVRWRYDQVKGPAKHYSVWVDIEPAGTEKPRHYERFQPLLHLKQS